MCVLSLMTRFVCATEKFSPIFQYYKSTVTEFEPCLHQIKKKLIKVSQSYGLMTYLIKWTSLYFRVFLLS